MAGADEHDATSIPAPVGNYRAAARAGREGPEPLKGLRLGVPDEYFQPGMDAEVEAAVRAAIDELARAGARIVKVSLPNTKYAIATYYLVCTAEASSNLARYDGVRHGYRASDARSLEEMYTKTRGEGFGAGAEAPHHARHLRAARRLLRGLLRQGAARAPQDRRRFHGGVRAPATRSSRPRRRSRRSSSASAWATRCRCTSPTC